MDVRTVSRSPHNAGLRRWRSFLAPLVGVAGVRLAESLPVWDVAAIGEGETTLLALVDAMGDPAGISGPTFRDPAGVIGRTGRPQRRSLDDFRGFSLKWDRFNALEITRGCIFPARSNLNYYMWRAWTALIMTWFA
ncbi:hypothetical protein Ari01nite_98620 [Paractinoplanes rishiriensis]|uniref:Uncharacterized protein n=1 Tax=Paractinoplanes rishiriensis TaxID=1050105 RepID=A0A919N2X4_9ACTN|nr:hypothetical protein Ari01nite_98620 [Actinoplanes rishiriensis]